MKKGNKLTNKFKLPFFFLLIIFLYSFPTFYPYFKTPPNKVYLGQVSWFDPWDINVYVAAIRWSQENGFYFQNAYTTQPHKSVVFYPFYTLLGNIFPKLEPFLIFNLATTFAGFFLLFIIYKSSRVFLKNKKSALATTFLVCLAGGLGWIFFSKVTVPDLYMTPFTFTSTFQRAHEAIAISFYLSSLVLFFLAIKDNSIKLTITSGISSILFTFFYPFYLLSLYLICAFYSLYSFSKSKKRSIFIHILLLIFSTLPFGILYSLYLRSGSEFNNVLTPNLNTPNPVLLVLGYGILSPLLLLQFFLKKSWNKSKVFLNIWFFVSVFLSYLPFGFGRYYLRALFFPAVLICFNNLADISSRLRVKEIYVKRALFLILPISNILIILTRLTIATGLYTPSEWSFINEKEYQIFTFLRTNTPKGSGLITDDYLFGNLLPAHTNNSVYFGHNYQTPNASEKKKNIEKLYKGSFTENKAKEFLKQNYISYVLVTNKGIDFPKYLFLNRIFKNESGSIYTYQTNY